MKFLTKCSIIALLVVGFASSGFAYEALNGPTGVLSYDKDKSFEGYTLFTLNMGKTTYLINMEGDVVHTWEHKTTPGAHAVLLENGHLLRAGQIEQKEGEEFCLIGGKGGIIQEFDWEGNVVWEYKMFEPGKEIQHHSFKRMPNGNTLILGWESKTIQEVLEKGRDPEKLAQTPWNDHGRNMTNKFWVDFVREVNKEGETVWEWHAWDHIGTGPDELDINYKLPDPLGDMYANSDWTHFNTVDYIPETDTVVLNSRNFAEFYFVDHETGEIEYRWGNPTAYGWVEKPSWYDDGDQRVFGSHCPTPLENGNILLFDNGSERPEGWRSRAVEVNPDTDEIVWEYKAKHKNSFFSYRQGAVQRLSNGNTLITSTHGGHIFEVTKDKEVVWEFVSPVFPVDGDDEIHCTASEDQAMPHSGPNSMFSMIHRSYRYGPDYPGLQGKDLSVKEDFGCPKFFKVWKKGAELGSSSEEAEETASEEEMPEEGPDTMKEY